MSAAADRIAELRRRYEDLKAKGSAPKSLPGPSPLPASDIESTNLVWREMLPAGWYWTGTLRRGQILRIVNVSGRSAVAFTTWSRAAPTERFYHGDTVKIQWTSKLQKGRLLLSEMGRVLASIVDDSSGWHDVLVGGSNSRSAERQFGQAVRNTRDNLIAASAKFGLGLRDIPPIVSFFAPVTVEAEGRLAWHGQHRRAGDYVALRAEQDLLVALSNCPHPLDAVPKFDPGDVQLFVHRSAPYDQTDLCRTATDEAVRAFENTDAPVAL